MSKNLSLEKGLHLLLETNPSPLLKTSFDALLKSMRLASTSMQLLSSISSSIKT